MEKTKKFQQKEHFTNPLLESMSKASSYIQSQDFSSGLEELKKCEKSLEVLVNRNLTLDSDLILVTLHNIALCYQRLNNFIESSAYLEACVYNVKSKLGNYKSPTTTRKSDKIRKIRYLCLLYIQLADCFAKQKNHPSALDTAKKAVKASILSIKLCLNHCTNVKLKKLHTQSPLTSTTKPKGHYDFYNEAHDLLQFLYLLMNGKSLKKNPDELTLRTVLGGQKGSDWIEKVTFDEIFEIKHLAINELKALHSIKVELSRDFMLDKICMAISAYYLVYREFDIISHEPVKAKGFLKRAISLCKAFVPPSCPLFSTLTKEYSRKYISKSRTEKKTSLRSRSTKEVRNNNQKYQKKLKKTHIDVKVIPWIVRSERNKLSTGKKDPNAHSEETLKAKMQMSMECFEKTEPEPPLSEESSEEICNNELQIGLFSSDLYGDYYEEEPDKYEYMPLKRN